MYLNRALIELFQANLRMAPLIPGAIQALCRLCEGALLRLYKALSKALFKALLRYLGMARASLMQPAESSQHVDIMLCSQQYITLLRYITLLLRRY